MLFNPHSDRRDASVGLIDEAYDRVAEIENVRKFDRFGNGSIEAAAAEDVAEPFPQAFENIDAGVERDRFTSHVLDRAEFVDSMTMIRMIVGDDDSIQFGYVGGEQLLAQVGSAVDQ